MPRPDLTSSPDTPKNQGHVKPDYAGKFFGQTSCADKRVRTGKRYKATIDDKEAWIPVREVQTIHYWIWDGTEWLEPSEFNRRHKPQSRGKVLVSKHDFDALGNPNKFRRIKR